MPDAGIGELIGGLLIPALEGGAEAGGGGLASLFGLGGEAAAEAGGGLAAGLGAGAEGALDLGAAGAGAGLGEATAGLGAGLGEGAVGGLGESAAGGVESLFGLGDATIPAGATETMGTAPAGLTQPISSAGVTSVGPTAGPTIDIGALTANPAVTTAGPAAGAAGGPAGTGGLDLTSLLKNVGWKDLLGPAVAAGGLGYQVLKGQQDLPSTKALKDQLGQITQDKAGLTDMGKGIISKGQEEGAALRGTGEEYTKYLAQGTLPPTMQAQLDQEAKDAKAAVVSRYASMGLPTDPNKNSSLMAELTNIDNQVRIKSSSLAKDLLQGGTSLISAGTGIGSSTGATGTSLVSSGANLSGLQTSLLQMLSGIDQKQTENMGKAIANFAAALAGNRGGVTLKVA